ncbi:hypothetical protein E8E11_011599, partial [Didymella keratinophila]
MKVMRETLSMKPVTLFTSPISPSLKQDISRHETGRPSSSGGRLAEHSQSNRHRNDPLTSALEVKEMHTRHQDYAEIPPMPVAAQSEGTQTSTEIAPIMGDGFVEQQMHRIRKILISGPEELIYNKKLASWYYQKGDLDKAQHIYEFVVNDPLQEQDEGYLLIMLHLAQISWFNGKYHAAEQRLRGLFYHTSPPLISISVQSPKWTYDTARWLALTQWKQSDYDQAKTTIEECRKRIKSSIEPSTEPPTEPPIEPPTLMSTLALVLASAGAFKRAWKLSKQAAADAELLWKLSDSLQPSKNHDTMTSDYRFCLLKHARISTEKWLGPKHFVTLDAASLRTWLLVFDNSTVQVEEEIQRTLRQMREQLGEEHPSTLQAITGVPEQ